MDSVRGEAQELKTFIKNTMAGTDAFGLKECQIHVEFLASAYDVRPDCYSKPEVIHIEYTLWKRNERTRELLTSFSETVARKARFLLRDDRPVMVIPRVVDESEEGVFLLE